MKVLRKICAAVLLMAITITGIMPVDSPVVADAKIKVKKPAKAVIKSVKENEKGEVVINVKGNATVYDVFRREESEKNFKKVGSMYGYESSSYAEVPPAPNKTYYYKVRGINYSGYKKAKGAFSEPKKINYKFMIYTEAVNESTIKVGANFGYETMASEVVLYRRAENEKNFSSVATKTSVSYAFEYKDKDVKLGKKYYYKAKIKIINDWYKYEQWEYDNSFNTVKPKVTYNPRVTPVSGSSAGYYWEDYDYPDYSYTYTYTYTTKSTSPKKSARKGAVVADGIVADDSVSPTPGYTVSPNPDYTVSPTPAYTWRPTQTPRTTVTPIPTSAAAVTSAPAVNPYAEYYESDEVLGMSGPSKSKIKKIKVVKFKVMKFSWKKVSSASGYELLKENGGSYKKVKTVTSNKTSVKIKGVSHGDAANYVVVPYVNIDGEHIRGQYSKSKYGVMNYYACATETYNDKRKRIFGKGKVLKSYGSASKAAKHMKTFTIRVWDFAHGNSGRKITRHFSLTMHKNIASSVKRAFEEIYKGKEKFPIYSIGGFSYRWGEHGLGLAIDINPNENYEKTGNKITCGTLYKPGKNPYSIPTDGEVAKILNKYGFTQGIWGHKVDYMHFSYFGG